MSGKTENHVIPAIPGLPKTEDDHYVIKIDGEEFIRFPGDYFDGIKTYHETIAREDYSLCELLVWRGWLGSYVRQAYSLRGGA